MKTAIISLAVAAALSSCSIIQPRSPEATARTYMNHLAKGETSRVDEFSCFQDPENPQELSQKAPTNITSWEITRSRPGSFLSPDDKLTVIEILIASEGLTGSTVERIWEMQVWEPEELYQSFVRMRERTDEIEASTIEAMEQANQILISFGQEPEPIDFPEIEPVNRDEYTRIPYCVLELTPR